MTRPVQTKQEVLDVLRAHESELRAMGIEHLDLFGSFARDEAGPESDVDVFGRLHPDLGMTVFDAEERLRQLMNRRVDLVTHLRGGLFRQAICRDLVHVF